MKDCAHDAQNSVRSVFEVLLQRLALACTSVYGERLVSLVVFGSVGRGVPRPDSDIDLLIVAEPLPSGRIPRVEEFRRVEAMLAPDLAVARDGGVHAELSPLFKTPAEARRGSPLFLDILDDGRILFDSHDFFAGVLARLRARLAELGARRIWRGDMWFWDLKPDYKPGEVFEL